jgi:hypothetical protein
MIPNKVPLRFRIGAESCFLAKQVAWVAKMKSCSVQNAGCLMTLEYPVTAVLSLLSLMYDLVV